MSKLTTKQEQVLTILRERKDQGDGWVSLNVVADVLGANRRSAATILGALERMNLVLRWEPVYRSHPRFTVLGE